MNKSFLTVVASGLLASLFSSSAFASYNEPINCNNLVVPISVSQQFIDAGYSPKTYSSIDELPLIARHQKSQRVIPEVNTVQEAEELISSLGKNPVLVVRTGAFRKEWDTFIDNDLIDINIPHPIKTSFAVLDLYAQCASSECFERDGYRVITSSFKAKLPYDESVSKDVVVVSSVAKYFLGTKHKATGNSQKLALKSGIKEFVIEKLCIKN